MEPGPRKKALGKRSLEILRQLNARIETVLSLYLVANAARAEGDYAEAEKLFQEAIDIGREHNDPWQLAYSLAWQADSQSTHVLRSDLDGVVWQDVSGDEQAHRQPLRG